MSDRHDDEYDQYPRDGWNPAGDQDPGRPPLLGAYRPPEPTREWIPQDRTYQERPYDGRVPRDRPAVDSRRDRDIGRRTVPPRRRRPTPIVLAGRTAFGALSAVVILASGIVWSEYKDLTDGMHTSDSLNVIRPGQPGYVAPSLNGDVNLLLIGLDSRKDMNGDDLPKSFVEDQLHAGSSDIGGYNTNVLILLHIPSNGGQVTGFSIPRDDYVHEPGGAGTDVGEVPDLGKHKIKEAYGRAKVFAEKTLKAQGVTDKAVLEAKSREVGRESTIRAVQLLTGVKVDHIAEVNLVGFYDIAKAVGPIEVCLNHPVDDPIMDGAGTGLKLPAGHSTLDAAQSLQFVRQRFHLINGDLDRNRRQQAFLSSVTHKLKTEGVVGDLGKISSLFNVVKNDLVIDDDWDIINFAMAASNLTGGNAVINELPITGQPVLPGDGSVNTVDPVAIKNIVTTAFNNDSVSASAPETGATSLAPATSDPASAPTADPAAETDAGQDARASSGSASVSAPASASTSPADAEAPPSAAIDLFNATRTKGLATAAANLLTTSGWPVDKAASSPTDQTRTTVLYGRGAEESAKQLAAKLGLTATPVPSRSVAANHVSVYLGEDYSAPSSAAASDFLSGASPSDPGAGGSGGSGSGSDAGDSSVAPVGQSGASASASASASAAMPPAAGINMSSGITCVN
jgi:LCP family protein required for cell wall assembly